MLSDQSVQLYPLTFVQEKDGVSVGRFGTEKFAIFPPDGAALVQKLQAGLSVSEAARWYEQTYHEAIDMENFLDTLQDLDFLCKDDNAVNPSPPSFLTRLGAAAFSPGAWVLYVIMFAGSVYSMYLFPALLPKYSNLFFSSYLTVVVLGLLVGQLPGLFFHEFYHMLAGWRRGIPCQVSIGRRMYFLVFSTSMPGIWGLRRQDRYLPYLAGMIGDIVWFSLLILTAGALIALSGHVTPTAAFLLAMAFLTIMRFVWQFFFYLKTDIYYLITNTMGCVNLHETTQKYLKNTWYRLTGTTHKLADESAWTEADRQAARWYAWLYGSGWVLTWVIFLLVAFPVMKQIIFGLWSHLTIGTLQVDPHEFWDAMLFVLLNALQLSIVAWLFLKERKARRSQSV